MAGLLARSVTGLGGTRLGLTWLGLTNLGLTSFGLTSLGLTGLEWVTILAEVCRFERLLEDVEDSQEGFLGHRRVLPVPVVVVGRNSGILGAPQQLRVRHPPMIGPAHRRTRARPGR